MADRAVFDSNLKLYLNGSVNAACVYSVVGQSIIWANKAALTQWGAASFAEIDQLFVAQMSDKDVLSLEQVGAQSARRAPHLSLAAGDGRAGQTAALRPLQASDGTPLVLLELETLPQVTSDATALLELAAAESTTLLSLCREDGKIVFQNAAADLCFGPLDPSRDQWFQDRFADAQLGQDILQHMSLGEILEWQAHVQTCHGDDIHLVTVSRSRKQVGDQQITVISQVSITNTASALETQFQHNAKLTEELVQSNQRLQFSEARYARAVESAAIWDWDRKKNQLFLSPSFYDRIGYSQSEIVKILREGDFWDIVHTEDVHENRKIFHGDLAHGIDDVSLEFRVIAKDGAVFWFHMQGRHFRDEFREVRQSSGLLTDITERKVLENRYMAAQRLEAIGQLAGGIAHDFNNLLAIILGSAELMSPETSSNEEMLSDIRNAAQKGADLTKQILAFSRKQALNPSKFGVSESLLGLKRSLLRVLGEKVQLLEMQSEDLWEVFVDRHEFENALVNLAVNARDAMQSHGALKISCRNVSMPSREDVENLQLEPGDYVELAVTDTGVGMRPDVIAKAFEPFFTTKDVGAGSGLGLPMVLGFARQSGGDVSLESQIGKGTTVRLYLPRAKPASNARDGMAVRHATHGTALRIHVLDDDFGVGRVVAAQLEALGHRPEVSQDLTTALSKAELNATTDIFLIDLVLGRGETGFDFVEQLQSQGLPGKVILMTGHSEDLVEKLQRGGGTFPVLRKPFSRDNLAQTLKAATERLPN